MTGWGGQGPGAPSNGGQGDPFAASPGGSGQADPFAGREGAPSWPAEVPQDNVAGYGWPAQPAQPRRARIGVWVGAGGAVAAVLIAVAVVLLRSGGTSSSTVESKKETASSMASSSTAHRASTAPTSTQVAEKLVSYEAARRTLVGIEDVAQLMGVAAGDLSNAWDNPTLNQLDVAPAVCGGIATPALSEAYDGSGYDKTRLQVFQGPGVIVFQQVSTFPSSAVAKEFVVGLNGKWSACANTVVTVQHQGSVEHWKPGPSTLAGDVLTVTVNKEEDDEVCHRALTARYNVVADVLTCDFNGSLRGVALLQKIVDRIPRG